MRLRGRHINAVRAFLVTSLMAWHQYFTAQLNISSMLPVMMILWRAGLFHENNEFIMHASKRFFCVGNYNRACSNGGIEYWADAICFQY